MESEAELNPAKAALLIYVQMAVYRRYFGDEIVLKAGPPPVTVSLPAVRAHPAPTESPAYVPSPTPTPPVEPSNNLPDDSYTSRLHHQLIRNRIRDSFASFEQIEIDALETRLRRHC